MSVLKVKRLAFAAMLGMVLAQGSSVTACDPPVRVQVSIERSTMPVDELISQLEKLVEPVCEKVTLCNEELVQAQAAVDSLNGKLIDVSAEQTKSLRALKLLKQVLSQPGCTIKIDDHCYERETIGGAIEVKLASYRAQSTEIARLTNELSVAQKNVETVAAKVVRWVAKEKELLAQIDALESLTTSAQNDVAAVQKQVSTLTGSINVMLQSSPKVSAPSRKLTKPEAELVAEVDQVLSQK